MCKSLRRRHFLGSQSVFESVVHRLLCAIPVLLGISFVSFIMIFLAPGDYLSDMYLNPEISPETIDQLRCKFGLDQPMWEQYLRWLSNLLRGDLGISFTYHMPVRSVIASRAWNTVVLAVMSTGLAWTVAVPAGILAAMRHNTWTDRTLTAIAIIGLCTPSFFLALLVLFIVVYFNIALPIGGATSVEYAWMGVGERLVDRILHLVIPVTVLSAAQMGAIMRHMRSSMLDSLRQEYTTTAKAKGLSRRGVVVKHALRNAINPLVSLLGLEIGGLLSGAALTEAVTGWPGLGKVILAAAISRDLHLVMGCLMMGSALLFLGNLVADVLLALSDPRIRNRNYG